MKPRSFKKFDGEKPDISQIWPGFIFEVAKALTYGAAKYGRDNWKQCQEPERYFAACQRHLWAFAGGETHDPESGLHHLAHAAASLMIYFWLVTNKRAAPKDGPEHR